MIDNFNELKVNPLNPRTINRQQFDALQAALKEFGDLGAFVYNQQLDRIVSGHQRRAAFERMGGDKEIVITQKFETQTPDGTVALGYIKHNGNYYAYRVVDWPEVKDLAAMEAANRIGGDWELEKLADVNDMIRQLDESYLSLTGQTEDELNKLMQLGNEPEKSSSETDDDRMTFKFSMEQAEIVNEALGYVLAKHNVTSDNLDIRANAVYYICRDYLDKLHGLKDDADQQPPVAEADGYKTQ